MAYDSEVSDLTSDLLILQRARDELVRCGWMQGTTGDPAKCEPVCLLGTLGPHVTFTAWHNLAVLLGFAEMDDAFDWNDAPERTQAEVLARFDAAILKLTT